MVLLLQFFVSKEQEVFAWGIDGNCGSSKVVRFISFMPCNIEPQVRITLSKAFLAMEMHAAYCLSPSKIRLVYSTAFFLLLSFDNVHIEAAKIVYAYSAL